MKGLNFATTPLVVPTKEIVPSVEQGISNLAMDTKDEIRSDICNNLNRAKPTRTQNITRQERKSVQDHKRDDRILVLPADKETAVVVLNSSDYRHQITNMLENKSIYAPITDQRRNPVS